MMCGCGQIQSVHEDLYVRGLAHKAYAHTNPHPLPAGHALGRDYERGWKQGFYNVSLGMDPCPPSAPPEAYWKPKYQCPAGRQAIDAWFAGYQAGALTAQVDCYEDGRLPLGPECQREIRNACQGDCLQDCVTCFSPQAFATPSFRSDPEDVVPSAPPAATEQLMQPEPWAPQAIDSQADGPVTGRQAFPNPSLPGLQASRVYRHFETASPAVLQRLPLVTDGGGRREAAATGPYEPMLANRPGDFERSIAPPAAGLRRPINEIADRRLAEPKPR